MLKIDPACQYYISPQPGVILVQLMSTTSGQPCTIYSTQCKQQYGLRLEAGLIRSRRGLNPEPFDLQSPAVPTKLPFFGCS